MKRMRITQPHVRIFKFASGSSLEVKLLWRSSGYLLQELKDRANAAASTSVTDGAHVGVLSAWQGANVLVAHCALHSYSLSTRLPQDIITSQHVECSVRGARCMFFEEGLHTYSFGSGQPCCSCC